MKKNINPQEVAKFSALKEDWWNTTGPMQALHRINPCRAAYISKTCALKNKNILDVGCGGGILAESLAKSIANVTAIDASEETLQVAKQHAKAENLTINYKLITVEELAVTQPAHYDIITCMELLEHVPDPHSIIAACAQLTKKNGTVFFSTINRNYKAFLGAIIAGEYLLGMLPKGTHEYNKFITPAELNTWGQAAGLSFQHLQGVSCKPLTNTFYLSDNTSINYMVTFKKL